MRDGWRETTLGDMITIRRISVNPASMPVEVRLYSIPALDAHKAPEVVASSQIGSNKFALQEHSLLVSMLNPRIHRQVLAEPGTFCSTEFVVAAPREGLALKYLALVTSQSRFQEHLVGRAKGTTGSRSRSKAADVANYLFRLPPLDEQRRIVDLVGALDDTIAAAEFQETAARRVFEHFADSQASPSISRASSILADAVKLVDCEHKTAPGTEDRAYARSVGTGNIRQGVIRLDAAKPISQETFEEWTARAVPAVGDVVLTREAPPGQVGLVTLELGRIALGQRTVLLQPKEGTYGPFVWSLLVSQVYQSWIQSRTMGQTVQRINVRDILAIPVSLPSYEEQEQVALAVQAALDVPLAIRVEVDRLRDLRSNLLTALLSGEHPIPESYDELMEELAA